MVVFVLLAAMFAPVHVPPIEPDVILLCHLSGSVHTEIAASPESVDGRGRYDHRHHAHDIIPAPEGGCGDVVWPEPPPPLFGEPCVQPWWAIR